MSTRKKYTAHKKRIKKTRNNKRKIHKNRKSRRSRRNLKGGMCFGNGVGANSNDPNFSIFNTRALQLFPYKPTN